MAIRRSCHAAGWRCPVLERNREYSERDTDNTSRRRYKRRCRRIRFVARSSGRGRDRSFVAGCHSPVLPDAPRRRIERTRRPPRTTAATAPPVKISHSVRRGSTRVSGGARELADCFGNESTPKVGFWTDRVACPVETATGVAPVGVTLASPAPGRGTRSVSSSNALRMRGTRQISSRIRLMSRRFTSSTAVSFPSREKLNWRTVNCSV